MQVQTFDMPLGMNILLAYLRNACHLHTSECSAGGAGGGGSGANAVVGWGEVLMRCGVVVSQGRVSCCAQTCKLPYYTMLTKFSMCKTYAQRDKGESDVCRRLSWHAVSRPRHLGIAAIQKTGKCYLGCVQTTHVLFAEKHACVLKLCTLDGPLAAVFKDFFAERVASSQLSISAALWAGVAAGKLFCRPSAAPPGFLTAPGLDDTPAVGAVTNVGGALSSASAAAASPSAAAAMQELVTPAAVVRASDAGCRS